MASRFSAARPKRTGEAFARAHHGESRGDDDDGAGGPSSSKKVRFDVRNPSALAPSAADDDDDDRDNVLDADVIGASGRATKRGAVNIDGYDSDSDNENFDARAEARGKKGKEAEDVDLAAALDNYKPSKDDRDELDDDQDDEVDMFGDSDADDDKKTTSATPSKKQAKSVRLLDDAEIEGQEDRSRSGGRMLLNDGAESDSDDSEADIAAAIAEEAVDEEVGAGGLKKHAPKIDAFNMRAEQEEGAFDEAGNFIRKAVDANAVHDRWLEGVSKKEMKRAAAAQEKRDAEMRRQQRENDALSTGDLIGTLIRRLQREETALDALARLRRSQTKAPKKVPKWKQKKNGAKAGGATADAMDVDVQKEPEDPKQVKIKETIDAIADAADKLMSRDYPNIYDTERERLVREYRAETGEPWVDPPEPDDGDNPDEEGTSKMWEFRWTDGRDNAPKQGPFDGPTMKQWQDAGYFGEGVEFRQVGDEGGWTRVASFA